MELNLLFTWTGKESDEQVKQIRAIHIYNLLAGLRIIWRSLEQCYGSAEVIEEALFKWIDNFPKITSQDPHKLKKFCNILMKLQCAEDGDLPGLSFLDMA